MMFPLERASPTPPPCGQLRETVRAFALTAVTSITSPLSTFTKKGGVGNPLASATVMSVSVVSIASVCVVM